MGRIIVIISLLSNYMYFVSIINCHLRHCYSKRYKDIDQKNGNHKNKYIKPYQISSSNTLWSPWTMMIIVTNTHIAVFAVKCTFLYSNIASSAQSFWWSFYLSWLVLAFLFILYVRIGEIFLQNDSWVAYSHS